MTNKSIQKTAYILMLGLASVSHAISITDVPVGWASQNGGTTGGAGGTVKMVTTLADLQTWSKATGKYIIYVSGTMGADVTGTTNPNTISQVTVTSDKTIFGLPGATLIGAFQIKSAKNVIIRNMKVQGPGSVDVNGIDPVWVDQSTNVWLDHLDVTDGQDGNLDITNGSNYVTVSYTKFTYTSRSKIHQFCNLLGNSDTKTTDRGKIKVTLEHNWWADGVVERMPRVRFGQVHVVNNLFTSKQGSYSVRAGIEADILVEANAFIGVQNPIDLYQNNYTAVTSKNNYFDAGVTGGKVGGTKAAFTPPYTMAIDLATVVEAKVRGALGAGATLCDVRASNCLVGVSSSSVVVLSSSSKPVSSSSVVVLSSSSKPVSSSSVVVLSSSSKPVSSSSVVVLSSGRPFFLS
jgi:pectate lyase